MQKTRARLRSLSLGILLTATILILLLTRLFATPLLIYLPWIGAPVLAVVLFRLWLPCSMLPPPPPAYTPPSLLTEGSFALSGAQFFPVREDYAEAPPQPPEHPRFIRAKLFAWLTLALSVLGCLIPFFCVWASFLAVTLSCLNQYGFAGSRENRPVSIRRLTLLAFCLGLAGIWSSVLILDISLRTAG